ncbi:hypothetical protein SAMD00079811_71930 [Scytonema sp. HK-05]|uniref:hypothetical protein n=1 Tax=Scytonema sp. HK-05 TaxID=1137095 RepID=UPI0009363C54|nr:hypothetical protein [Scytonema sp. HK-05]OKH55870.1 hypothetical protein NIES2130_26025 [Scytonema sp. HK-05]BAY49564.1 hypothetical protein SAMD00079811_71930 [Scytonema sp. HK-05]
MTATLTRPAWTTDLEVEIFNKLIDKHAPHLPKTRLHDPRPPATQEEIENFYRFRVAGAAHDLFIVQVCAKIIDQIPDPELQLFLSRQIGDDGAHAQNTRERSHALSGYDPIEEIQKQVQKHWDYMGDLPIRNWQGFLAFELHYELHIVALLFLNSRTSKINDPESGKFAAERILPDEAYHRLGVVDWWQRKFDQASPAEKSELVAQVLEADEEGQRRRNPYLKEHWQITHRAIGSEIDHLPVIYDAWRREVLSYFLDIPISKLPKLVSVND